VKQFLQDKVQRGMKLAVATFGEKGSLAWDGKVWTACGIYPAGKVVNTVGAGDSYIAGFLSGLLRNEPIDECMRIGSRVAAQVVSVFEPWVTEES
jgi:fructoselysine 6-kinase